MRSITNYALIGAVVILGIALGTLYVHAVGGQRTLTLSEGEPKTVEERMALENEAIQIALSDPRVKPLTEGKEVRIFSTFCMRFKIVFDNETKTGPGWVSDFHLEWDQKYRALVTIRYPDDTGYSVDINITDKIVGEPKMAVWEEGKYFKYLP